MIVTDPEALAAKASSEWGTQSARLEKNPNLPGVDRPTPVLEPSDASTTAAMLHWAASDRLAIAPVGGGTKWSWGPPPRRVDVVLSTARLRGPIDHCPGDLTTTIPAGCTLSASNRCHERERQWLPIDAPFADRATIGGIVATNASGPRRHRHGTPRDLIIGVEMALTNGRVAKAGGRVVKNVAGYDVGRLLCGSFGSLAVITGVTFKLAPLPPTSRTVVASMRRANELGDLALALSATSLTPSAVALESSPLRLLIRFETTPRATDDQASAAIALCERHGGTPTSHSGDDEQLVWRRHEEQLWETGVDTTIVKVSVLPTQLSALLERTDAVFANGGVEWWIAGSVLGVLMVRISGPIPAQLRAIGQLRHVVSEANGTSTLLHAPLNCRQQMDWSAEVGDALPLMRSLKAQFDPYSTLVPGRGPGGV